MKKPKRAFALVGALTVLMALGFIGVSFVTLGNMQLKISKSYCDKVQSNFLSQGGIDLAVSKLYQYFRQDDWYNRNQEGFMVSNWHYGGEDINGNGKRDLMGEDDFNGDLSMFCPLAMAPAPSFFLEQYQGNITNLIGTGYSSKYDFSSKQAILSLKVEDLSAKIAIVEPLEITEELTGTAKILYNLLEILQPGASNNHILVQLHKVNQLLKSHKGRLPSKSILNSIFSTSILRQISVYGWQDASTIRPPTKHFLAGTKIKNSVYQKRNISLQPRVPVNINTASLDVLTSCLNGIKAHKIVTGGLERDFTTNQVSAQDDLIDIVEINKVVAKQVAVKIQEERSKNIFTSWQDFARFLAQLIGNTISVDQAALIWANANPNTNNNKNHPDFPDGYLYPLWSQQGKKLGYRIDKLDLIVYTTEFCFFPCGYFDIESLSRTIENQEIAAQTSHRSIVKIFDVYKQSTQEDFLNNQVNRSSSVSLYPEANSKSNLEKLSYDGYISLTPKNYKAFGKYKNRLNFFASLLPEDGIVKNQRCDGAFVADDPMKFTTNTLKKGASQGAATMLCMWYKPIWDITDPYARPHSIIAANGSKLEGENTFQIYSESKHLDSFAGVKARWSLFVWDASEWQKYGRPLKLTVALPDEIGQNRWIFVGVYWGAGEAGMKFNQVELGKKGKKFHKMQLFRYTKKFFSEKTDPVTGKKVREDGGSKREFAFKIGEEKQDIDRYKFADLLEKAQRSSNVLDKNGLERGDKKEGGKSFQLDETKYDLLVMENEENKAKNILPEDLVFGPSVEPNASDIQLSGSLKWANKKNISKYFNVMERLIEAPTVGVDKVENPSEDIDDLSNLPKQQWLQAPSHGVYSNVMVFKLANGQQATEVMQNVLKEGRYQTKSASYKGVIELPTPLFFDGSVTLGGLRWTEYRPQDCLDLKQQEMILRLTLYDADNNVLYKVLNRPSGNSIAQDSTSYLTYQLDFLLAKNSKPVVAAPMFDDLTITYSLGWKFLEYQ